MFGKAFSKSIIPKSQKRTLNRSKVHHAFFAWVEHNTQKLLVCKITFEEMLVDIWNNVKSLNSIYLFCQKLCQSL